MSFLDRVTGARRSDAERRRALGALEVAQAGATAAPSPRPFADTLGRHGLSLIAEVKRASPSAGDIAPGVDRIEAARAYERGGAAAVSVLTEPDFFKGSLDDLTAVHDAVTIPVLRKDFICDPLQVWEARAAGADAILLIVAALEQHELVSLSQLAMSLGMAVLVEVHEPDEATRAVQAGATIIGINTRNLATLHVDPGMVARVRPALPDDVLVVGESGIGSRADVVAMEAAGVDAILVGETLMRSPDPAAKVRELLGHDV